MTIPSPQRIVQPEAPVTPEDPNTWITSMEEVIKRINESMKAMKKENEDIASRLPPWKEPGLEEKCKAKRKGKYRWVKETMKALSMVVAIHLPRAGKALPIKGPTMRKLRHNNLMARNLTIDGPIIDGLVIAGPIIAGLARLRTKRSRSMKMPRT